MGLKEKISGLALFEGLPEDQLRDLSMIVVDQVLKKGQEIFYEGEEGAGFYVVVSGRIKIYKTSMDGKEQILHIFGPGEPFGEVPVFSGKRFPANAAAMEKSRIFFFPRDAFVDLVKRNPDLALNMLAVLSRRLRRFTQLVEELSLKEVPSRLAAYLVYLSNRKGGAREIKLDISKAQLASLLGTIPETLSRILGKMKRAGFIDMQGPHIWILDYEGLEGLAESGGGL